jgi:protein-tyrosine phosphatase
MNTLSAETMQRAASLLREGALVILPTETLYGVAAAASNPGAVSMLRDLITVKSGSARDPVSFTWHAHDPSDVVTTLGLVRDDHRRAFEQLLPGPVRLSVHLDAARSRDARASLGVDPGVLDVNDTWSVRVPAMEWTRQVIEASGVPVLMERLSAIGLGQGIEVGGMDAKAATMGIRLVADAGPTRFAGPSTPVMLGPDGVEVTGTGVYEARYIHKKMHRLILFVCTGNTCRSPMAEAIARNLLARSGVREVSIASAGVAAGSGSPMTAEARGALEEMRVEPGQHRSRMLDGELVASSHRIYALTSGHLKAIRGALPPAEAAKAMLLDPAGRDVPDPIGGPLEEYRETAALIAEMVRARFAELGIEALPSRA